MFSNLRKISEKVVPPLVEQVANYEKENIKLRGENKKLQTNLKMLHAVVRSPKLCDLY